MLFSLQGHQKEFYRVFCTHFLIADLVECLFILRLFMIMQTYIDLSVGFAG